MQKYTCSLFIFLCIVLFVPSLLVCRFMFYSVSLAPFHPLCSKLSLNEFQIMLKCSKRHFQLFYTVILPAKLLSTHAHTEMQTVWRSIKSLWHLHCCTIIILQWIISQLFPHTGQSQGDGKRQSKSETDTHYHIPSDKDFSSKVSLPSLVTSWTKETVYHQKAKRWRREM